MDSSSSANLIQGTLDLLILGVLAGGEQHGYGVSRLIRERSEALLEVKDAALYQALRRLERRRLVSSQWGLSESNRKARYYRLTATGSRRLELERAKWGRYSRAVAAVIGPAARGS